MYKIQSLQHSLLQEVGKHVKTLAICDKTLFSSGEREFGQEGGSEFQDRRVEMRLEER